MRERICIPCPIVGGLFSRYEFLNSGGHLGVQEVHNVPRSAWVKTDAASKMAVETHTLAESVFTHALRGTFCTPCTPSPRAHLCS